MIIPAVHDNLRAFLREADRPVIRRGGIRHPYQKNERCQEQLPSQPQGLHGLNLIAEPQPGGEEQDGQQEQVAGVGHSAQAAPAQPDQPGIGHRREFEQQVPGQGEAQGQPAC